MTKIQNFKNFYTSELVPALKKVEKARKGIQIKIFITVGAFVTLTPLFAFAIVNGSEDVFSLLYFIPVFAIATVFFYGMYDSLLRNTTYYKLYKGSVIGRIIQYVEPKLDFDNKEMIAKGDYFHSQLFDKTPVMFDGDDRISGTVDNVVVEFSELKTTFKNKADRQKYGSKFQFRGIFFVADCPTTFPADIIISPKDKARLEGEVVTTEHDEFNRKFTVKSLNSAERKDIDLLLTKDFMDRIVNYDNQFHNDIYISFVENSMYVAISHDKDLFEPTVWHSNLNFDATYQHFLDLYYPISIIEKLAIHKDISEDDENFSQSSSSIASA